MAEKQEDYRGYNLGTGEFGSMVSIKAKGQGQVPNVLKGLFTSIGQARQQIDSHFNSLKKGKRNGKTKGSNSG